MSKNLYIIAGCNGAGKTTASFTILPEILNCFEFVNADEIARGLSPFNPENVAIEAGKIMLKRIDELFKSNVDFAFETTLSSKVYRNKLIAAQKNNYKVTLLFFWLENVELAIDRVQVRVAKGGHNIPIETIRRRYKTGIKNLFDIYLALCDKVVIIDSSNSKYEPIARGNKGEQFSIINNDKWGQIKRSNNEA